MEGRFGLTPKEFNAMMASQYWQTIMNPERDISINGRQSNMGYWNLVCSIRDVKLYVKGIKITRSWKITDVKNYFNVKGNPTKVLESLEKYLAFINWVDENPQYFED